MKTLPGKIVFRTVSRMYLFNQDSQLIYCEKVPVFGNFLVRIFPHSDWIRRDTEYLPYSVFMRENTNHKNSKYGHFSRGDSYSINRTISFYLKACLSNTLQDSLFVTWLEYHWFTKSGKLTLMLFLKYYHISVANYFAIKRFYKSFV